jgi:hypothetical protein
MTIQQLVEAYERGAITGHHLVGDLLCQIDHTNVDAAMEALPSHLHDELRAFLAIDRPELLRSRYGPVPTSESLEIARQWLNAKQRLGIGAT